ncbi:MAG TPA: hypothetical protein VGD96_02255 [Bradyrhizobium sp.]
MASIEEIAKPLARAINIYSRVARHPLDDALRRELARHIKKLADQGIEDANRLTVHGLSYLRSREQRRRKRQKTHS